MINNPGTGVRTNWGLYTGDDTANRAIAHGLEEAPKLVLIFRPYAGASNGGFWYLHRSLNTILGGIYGAGPSVVTNGVSAPDNTNFYVGNASSYPASANGNGYAYAWVVFAFD